MHLPSIGRRVRFGPTLAAALACALIPARAGAQNGSSCTPDTSTAVKRLVVGLSADRELGPAARQLTTTVAAQIAAFVEAPARLTLDQLLGPDEWKDAAGTYRSEGLLSIGQIAMNLDPAGHVQRVTLDPGTGSPEVDRAILAGVAAADSSGVFPAGADAAPAAAGVRAPVRHVRLWVLTAASPQATWAAPLFVVAGRIPANATPAAIQSQSAPAYPRALLARRVEGDAYLAFEIDEQGRVPESSIQVLSADDSAFIEPARQSIRQASFVAATQGGCAVRAKMRQRVRFQAPATAWLGAGTATRPDSTSAIDAGVATPATLAEEGRWLAANVPKLSAAHVVLQADAHIGGTGVASGRTRVTRTKLDHCTLAVDRLFETEGTDPVSPVPKLRVSHRIPLEHVDPRLLTVQQQPAPGSGVRLGFVSSQPWRVVLALRDGSIRSDRDRDADPYAETGPQHTTTNDSELDLIVSSREAGTAITTHLQAAIMACQ